MSINSMSRCTTDPYVQACHIQPYVRTDKACTKGFISHKERHHTQNDTSYVINSGNRGILSTITFLSD